MSRFRARRKRQRRQRLFGRDVPPAWHELLQREFPLYRRLPPDLRRQLLGHIQIFLDEKVFVGCNGMEITEPVRVLIAAQACLLILNQPTDYYPVFQTILVYPDTFVVPVTERDGFIHSDTVSVRLGESWHRGPVVLAWDQVLNGARDDRDGHNVVMHEFAHKLDEENWQVDGLPVLTDPQQYPQWQQVLSRAYAELQQAVARHEPAVIDDYGASSPAEFFAVVTETFFERPHMLHRHHPRLYEQFQRFYRLDPLQWYPH
ncbi:MAG: M90 family metallopeptidase [Pseudomonadota bacterium]|nr:M90 family metallopeptidase [Pseudomonadota bacterium]